MPTLRDVLFADLDAELAATRRMLARVPWGRADWRPHERSMSLGALARHVATLPGLGVAALTTDRMDFGGARPPRAEVGSADELVALFDAKAAELRGALAATDDDRLVAAWPVSLGDRLLSEDPRHLAVRRWSLGHMAHHRGQLSVYLRLLDVPVPGVYGPSADDRRG